MYYYLLLFNTLDEAIIDQRVLNLTDSYTYLFIYLKIATFRYLRCLRGRLFGFFMVRC